MGFWELACGFSANNLFCQSINLVDLATLKTMSNLVLVKLP